MQDSLWPGNFRPLPESVRWLWRSRRRARWHSTSQVVVQSCLTPVSSFYTPFLSLWVLFNGMDHLRNPLFSIEGGQNMTLNLHLVNTTMTSTKHLASILNFWTTYTKNWHVHWLVIALPHDTSWALAHMTREASNTKERQDKHSDGPRQIYSLH